MSFTLDWQVKRLNNAVMETCENAVYDGAENVLKQAKARCPVESVESVENRSGSERVKQYGAASGSLKKSGRITKFKKQGVVGAYIKFGGIVVDGVDTYYGPFVELGTPGTRFEKSRGYYGHNLTQRVAVTAKPFLRPGLKVSKSAIKNAFRNKL